MGAIWKQAKVPTEILVKMYVEDKMSTQEIARIVGYKAAETVAEKLRKAGVYQKEYIDTGKIKALHKAGWNVKDIAEDVKVTEEIVIGILGGGNA